jgi:hypothetical protein
VKNTSIVQVVGFVDLMRAGMLVNNATYQAFQIFTLVGSDLFRDLLPAFQAQPPSRKGDECQPFSLKTSTRSFGRSRC